MIHHIVNLFLQTNLIKVHQIVNLILCNSFIFLAILNKDSLNQIMT